MDKHTIQNGVISLAVDSLGAELCSMRRLACGTEYLWPGNPQTWNGRAPILFPIIGPLLNGAYQLDGKTYQMQQHGFARRSQWQFVAAESRADFLLFRLEEDQQSLQQYPFAFVLEASYGIQGNELECGYRVVYKERQRSGAAASVSMPFSIGSHTAFRVPISAELRFSDYELEFECEENTLRYLQTSAGPLSGKTTPFGTAGRKLRLEHSFFAGGSIIFKELASKRIAIQSAQSERRVSIAFAGFPYCTLWTYLSSSEPYLCIEPWHGVTPQLDSSTDLRQREGSLFLAPGEEFRCCFQIDLE